MTNTISTLNGKFRNRYADMLENSLPRMTPIQEMVPFAPVKERVGDSYNQMVVLAFEHGITYKAASSGAFTLNDAVAATHKNASVTGAQIALASAIDIESLARGLDDGRSTGPDTMELVLGNMKDAIGKHVEMTHLWGGQSRLHSGWGVVGSISGTSTTRALVVALKDWSPAIWSGAEGMPIALYDNDGSGGIPSTGLAGHSSNALTISSVVLSTRTLNVTGNSTELGNVDTAVAAGDVFIYPKGALGAQWVGLNEISSNAGSLFGIDAASFAAWSGNTYDCGSQPLSFQKIVDGLDDAVGRGLDEDVTLLINHRAWSDIASDQAALRKFDASYDPKEFKNGAKSLKFMHQSGAIEVRTHRYMKEGYAMAVPMKRYKRLGATDITFKVPGTEEDFLFHLSTSMGVGLRAYTFQAGFTASPRSFTLYKGIVNG